VYLQAITEDPTFARAYAGLALTYAAEYRNQWVSDGAASLARALDIANTAVEIDPRLPEVHWALAYVKEQQRRHQEALAHLDQALRIAPNFADALALKAGIKTYIGAAAETVPLIREAMRLDPSAGYLYFMILGRAYFFKDDQDQAIINLREAASRNPEMLEVRVFLAAALERGGRHDEAAWEAQEILAIRPDFSAEAWLETHPMTSGGQIRQLVAPLADLGLWMPAVSIFCRQNLLIRVVFLAPRSPKLEPVCSNVRQPSASPAAAIDGPGNLLARVNLDARSGLDFRSVIRCTSLS